MRKSETEQLSLHARGRVPASTGGSREPGDAKAIAQNRGEMTTQLGQQRPQLLDAVAYLRQILFVAHGQREHFANPTNERRVDRQVVDRHRKPATVEVLVIVIPQGFECHLNPVGRAGAGRHLCHHSSIGTKTGSMEL